MQRFLERGGCWVLGQGALMVTVVVLAFSHRGEGRNFTMIIPGVLLLGLSAVVGLAGVIALGRNLTPFPKPSTNTRLMQRGIYAVIRHPLYTSVMAAALGWSLVWQSWPAVSAAGILILFLNAKAKHEERWLGEQFPEYGDYAKRVHRFIPWGY